VVGRAILELMAKRINLNFRARHQAVAIRPVFKVGTDRTAIYKWFDSEKKILYVGISNDPLRRHGEHRDKWWFPMAVRSEIEWVPSREAAFQRELELIRELRPPGNIAGNPDARRK